MKKRTLFLFQFFVVGVVMASTNSTNSMTTNNFGPCYFDAKISDTYKVISSPEHSEISSSAKRSLEK